MTKRRRRGKIVFFAPGGDFLRNLSIFGRFWAPQGTPKSTQNRQKWVQGPYSKKSEKKGLWINPPQRKSTQRVSPQTMYLSIHLISTAQSGGQDSWGNRAIQEYPLESGAPGAYLSIYPSIILIRYGRPNQRSSGTLSSRSVLQIYNNGSELPAKK